MSTVEIRLPQNKELPNQLADIYAWLAREQCAPLLRSSTHETAWLIVQVDFAIARDGDAFAKRFDGRVLPDTDPTSGRPDDDV